MADQPVIVKISSQSAASRAKHLRDFDSLAKLLGVADRRSADMTKGEERMIAALAESPGLSELGSAALRALLGSGVS